MSPCIMSGPGRRAGSVAAIEGVCSRHPASIRVLIAPGVGKLYIRPERGNRK